MGKVACESASKDNMVMVFGEITTSAKLNYDQIVRKAVKGIGYDSFEEALDSVDCRPGAIAVSLALREPKYQETAAYGHFGREPYTMKGIKFFEWENAKDLSKYASMNSAQVTAELNSSNYLQKWVD